VVHPPLQSESVLLARACGGDLDAYEQLVCLHQQLAFRTALDLARNVADAEEAAQEVGVLPSGRRQVAARQRRMQE
jgi:hypothetical protein